MKQTQKPFWQKRSRYKPDTIFSTPAMLWKAAQDYFNYIDSGNNGPPVKRSNKKTPAPADEAIADNVEASIIKTTTPYSLQGLCVYLGVSYKTFVIKTAGEGHEAFEEISNLLRDIIETQQFTGAVQGSFNATVISRKLGLGEKQTNEVAEKTDWKVTLDLGEPY